MLAFYSLHTVSKLHEGTDDAVRTLFYYLILPFNLQTQEISVEYHNG